MKFCSFCGKSIMMGTDISLGNGVHVLACRDCFDRVYEMDDLERAKHVLENGWIYEADLDALKESVSQMEAKETARNAELEAYRAAHAAGPCPKCGKRMICHEPFKIQTDAYEVFFSQEVHFWPSYSFAPHVCEACGYTEFYALSKLPRIMDEGDPASGSAPGTESDPKEV